MSEFVCHQTRQCAQVCDHRIDGQDQTHPSIQERMESDLADSLFPPWHTTHHCNACAILGHALAVNNENNLSIYLLQRIVPVVDGTRERLYLRETKAAPGEIDPDRCPLPPAPA